jgi:hypothetical protein
VGGRERGKKDSIFSEDTQLLLICLNKLKLGKYFLPTFKQRMADLFKHWGF